MADHVPYADIPQTMRDVLDGFYSAGAVERWWNAPILCGVPEWSTSAAQLWQTVEGRKFVQQAVEERAQAIARLDRDMEVAWNGAVARVATWQASILLTPEGVRDSVISPKSTFLTAANRLADQFVQMHAADPEATYRVSIERVAAQEASDG